MWSPEATPGRHQGRGQETVQGDGSQLTGIRVLSLPPVPCWRLSSSRYRQDMEDRLSQRPERKAGGTKCPQRVLASVPFSVAFTHSALKQPHRRVCPKATLDLALLM